jgi:adenylate cyclase
VIDKYIGDAIMAFWGPPFTDERSHALFACRAALDMMARFAGFRQDLPEILGTRKNLPFIDLRIGLYTGEMVVGSIGSDITRGYTVIGDAVNAGSRLEGVNKQYGTHILINEACRALAGDAIETRELDRVILLGREEPVTIHELLGLQGTISARTSEVRDRFADALAAYRAQDWTNAHDAFSHIQTLDSGDEPSAVFLKRIAKLREAPPGPGWDGVWRLHEK